MARNPLRSSRTAEQTFRAHHHASATLTMLPEPSPLARALAARRNAAALLVSA